MKNLCEDKKLNQLSCDRGRDIDDKSVSNAKLHFLLAIANVPNPLHFVNKLLFWQFDTDLDAVEILLVDLSWSDSLHNGLAY